MSSPFHIELAQEEDITAITQVIIPSFESIPLEPILGNTNTPQGHKTCRASHIQAWHEHAQESSLPCAIKCLHRDPHTGVETLVGFAEWFIYTHPRSAAHLATAHHLLSATWLPTETGARARAQNMMAPIVAARRKWMGSRPHAIFMYMAVDRAWRRRGIATRCVQWGLERCRDLGIPAYLEASEEGEHVYKRLGFVEVETVEVEIEGVKEGFPAMVWWPESMGEGERRPVGEVI